MRALDIDLDFFLNATCEPAQLGQRPCAAEAMPWRANDVRKFLEENCGLRKEAPVIGAIFDTHDKALDFWDEHMEKPFHITHIDAHSDLGIGRPGPAFVLESVITRAPCDRGGISEYRARGKLDEANYLLFALAFRWVKALENVRNPASRPDMPDFCGDGCIRLVSSVGRILPALDRREPAIPYSVYADYRDFRAEAPYDIATLAISPRYAPREADALIDVFAEYIRDT